MFNRMLLPIFAVLSVLSLAYGQQPECANFAPPLFLKGRKLFNSVSGEYVPIKGVNYYPRPNEGELTLTNSIDFFSEEHRHIWERDIEQFKLLGINTVRIYAINPSLNHDAFMCALKAAGIHAIVGLAAECENCAITIDPAPDCYPPELKTRGEFILHQFSRYENVLGFSAGNEIALEVGPSQINAPCLKKFIRDLRAYQESCDLREIPIGLAVVDWDREAKATYYNCRTDPDDELENAQFYGMNSYLHCTGWDDQILGYQQLRTDLASYELTIPVIITEFGCVDESFPIIDGREAQRTWGQVDAMFSPAFRQEMIGGLAFEYSTERVIAETIRPTSMWPFEEYGIRNFGLGYFTPRNCDDKFMNCTYEQVPQFELLRRAFNRVDVSDEPLMDDYDWDDATPTPQCPSNFAKLSDFEWAADQVESFQCPVSLAVFCFGVPEGCATFAPAQIPATDPPTPAGPSTMTDTPTASPVGTSTTDAPTASPVSTVSTDIPTDSPVGTSATEIPTDSPVGTSTTGAPTASPPEMPSVAPASSPTAEPTESTPGPTSDPTEQPPTGSGVQASPATSSAASVVTFAISLSSWIVAITILC